MKTHPKIFESLKNYLTNLQLSCLHFPKIKDYEKIERCMMLSCVVYNAIQMQLLHIVSVQIIGILNTYVSTNVFKHKLNSFLQPNQNFNFNVSTIIGYCFLFQISTYWYKYLLIKR